MLEFVKNKLLRSFKETKIPTTSNVLESSVAQHGEDSGAIPPESSANPLTEDIKE